MQPLTGNYRWRRHNLHRTGKGIPQSRSLWMKFQQTAVLAMNFRSANSEDCLYLNVWTPATKAGNRFLCWYMLLWWRICCR